MQCIRHINYTRRRRLAISAVSSCSAPKQTRRTASECDIASFACTPAKLRDVQPICALTLMLVHAHIYVRQQAMNAKHPVAENACMYQ